MADQKISQLPNASTLTGTEAVPVVQGSATVQTPMSAVRTYAVADLASTYGFATTPRNVDDMRLPAVNTSQIGRILTSATYGTTGFNSGFITLPIDSTPSMGFLAVTGSVTANNGRIWAGFKSGTNGNVTWTEFAKLDSPSFTRIGLGSTSAIVNSFLNIASGASAGGAATSYGMTLGPTVDSDVVTTYLSYRAAPFTKNSAGATTITAMYGFQATLPAVGTNNTITNVYGFSADQSLGSSSSVTNVYGIHSNIPVGIGNRYGLYMSGTAPNFMQGALGIGNVNTTGYNLRIDRNLTGATTAVGVRNASTIQSDVTTAVYMYDSVPFTTAAATLTSLAHYRAIQGTFGAGSVVTTQIGFSVDSACIGATSNWGFRGAIPSGTGRYNLYMDGTAANYIAGSVGIGTLNPLVPFQIGGDGTYREFRMVRTDNGANAQVMCFAKARGTESAQTAVVANDALGSIFWNGNDGSGSTVGAMKNGANIAAFVDGSVSANIVPARIIFNTTDTAGTTAERMRINNSGNIGIGTGSLGATTLVVGKNITGGTSAGGFLVNGVVQSDVTNFVQLNRTTAGTAAGVTLPTLVHYYATQGTFSGTVTNQDGFRVDGGLTGATNNYGFRGGIVAATGRWNTYMDGTAQNYFAGNVGIGTGRTVPTCALDVNGLVAQSTANTLTAVGTNLATALALTAARNVVTSAAAGTGVALPNVVGADIWVFNNQGTNAINVYPPTGTLNGAASVSLAANAKMMYIQIAAGVWYTMS